MSYSRYRKMTTPMLAGSAAIPATSTSAITCQGSGVLFSTVLPAPQITQTAAPLATHFSCWRRRSLARR